MKTDFDLIIAGGGPAGLFAAITASSNGLKVCILEKNELLGKKLLMSGSGRCNITNSTDIKDFIKHYGDKERFVKPALFNFTNKDLICFFESKKVGMKILNDKKVFPTTEKSQDILDLLLTQCDNNGVTIVCNTPVLSIRNEDNIFFVTTKDYIYKSTFLIIATGGSSYRATGSTGDGFAFAEATGHKIIPPKPALTPVIIKDFLYSSCSGIGFKKTPITIFRDNKKVGQRTGDILFTHKGLSGPGILDFSRSIIAGDTLQINVTPFSSKDEFDNELKVSLDKNGKKIFKNLLAEYNIPERFLITLAEINSIDLNTKCSDTNKETRKSIAKLLTELNFVVKEKSGFNEAMVTSGGVSTENINPNTMSSKIIPNLYFAGEVIDIDGDTGGYNLQFAFSSGKLSAESILKLFSK